MTPSDENREFTPIPNPFVTGAPVRGDSKVFFGREDHFTYVRQRLIAEKEGIVMLFAGERRSGKTSVLFQILAGKLGEEFLPVFVDMQQLASVTGDREFFARLAQLTIAAVKDDRLVPSFYDFSEGNPVITFDRLLEDIKRISPERQRLIFLVDEAEMLREKVVKQELSSAVLMSIASSLENRQVSFCLTGSPGLRDSDAQGWKHLLGKADYREVTFLSRDDTLRLIQQPVEGQVAYAEGVAEAICNLTAGHPFYTQVICTNVVDYLNQAKRNTLTMEDLAKVIRIIIANPPPQLVYAWEEQSPQEQIALSLVSEESTGPQNAVTPEALLETIKRNEYPLQHLKADGLHMVMENLYKRTVLGRTTEGAFYFQVDLFRQWIRQARSIWGLLEEQEPEKSRRSLWIGIAAGVVILAAGVGLWRGRVAEEEQAQVQQARGLTGLATSDIWVESNRRDVQVLVDGELKATSLPVSLPLKPGPHIIQLQHKNYYTLTETLVVQADKRDTLNKPLVRRIGMLAVTSQPPGAQVQVHGAEKDTSSLTPLQELELPTGEYAVTVSKDRFVPQTRRVTIADAVTAPLDFELQANVGRLYLESEPPGASILLDGQPQGRQTPAPLDDLAVGPHQVRLEKQDYSTLDTTLVVSLNRTNTVSLKLVLEPALVELISTPPGAAIYLDGKDTRKRTPSVLTIEPGRHQIRAEREGYEPYGREEEEFLPGRRYPYSIELKPYFGVVRIVKPRSGTILIDGTSSRKVPPADIPMSVGSHTLRYTQDTTIQVTRDDTIKISLE